MQTSHLILKTLVSCAFVLFSPLINSAQDMPLILKNQMQAIHTKALGETKASVLLIHGWGGQMNEVGNLYKDLAAQLSNEGIASLRINIRGESEQELSNYTLTSTFSSRVEDAKNGFHFLKNTYKDLPLGLVGFSLGGSTAMALVGNYPEQFKSIVLWSSAGNPKDIARTLFDDEQRKIINKTGSIILNEWVDITVTKEHLDGFTSDDIFIPFSKYKGALLCIRGTEDHIPDIDRKIIETAKGEVKEIRYIAGADHIFNVLEEEETYSERVLTQTVSWFKQTL